MRVKLCSCGQRRPAFRQSEPCASTSALRVALAAAPIARLAASKRSARSLSPRRAQQQQSASLRAARPVAVVDLDPGVAHLDAHCLWLKEPV